MSTSLGFSSITENTNDKKTNNVKNKTIKHRKRIKGQNFLNSMNNDTKGFALGRRDVTDKDMADVEAVFDDIGESLDDEFNKKPNDLAPPANLTNNSGPAVENFGMLKEGMEQQEKYFAGQNQYYNQYVPTYTGTAQNIPYYSDIANSQELSGSKDDLMKKLNYVVHMLEGQHDEKTGHVTEELVLYMFLGVFVIFVVDSFARAGKYTR